MLRHLTAPTPDATAIQATTQRFQEAIDAAAADGGGVVEAGPGEHHLGGLRLRSHVTLRLTEGCRLVAAADPAAYLTLPVPSQVFGTGLRCLIGAEEAHDVGIEGPGCIDLRGSGFMDWTAIRSGDHLAATVLARLPPQLRELTTVTARPRPENGILLHRCTGVRLSGFGICDSPSFTITLSACGDAMLRDLRIRNSLRVPNSDGIHLSGCHDVTISGCDVVSGDDAIAITALTAAEEALISTRIMVSGCCLRSHSAGVRIGYLRAQVSDVTLNDLLIHDSNRGIVLDAGAGGIIERVSITGVRCTTRIIPGEWWGQGEPLVINGATVGARIRDVAVRGLDADAEAGCVIIGTGGGTTDIALSACRFRMRRSGLRPMLGATADLRPATSPALVLPDPSLSIPWLVTSGVDDLRLAGIDHRPHPDAAGSFDTAAFDAYGASPSDGVGGGRGHIDP